MATCKKCNAEIKWKFLHYKSKWIPLNLDDAKHFKTCVKRDIPEAYDDSHEKPTITQELNRMFPRYKFKFKGKGRAWQGFGKRKEKGLHLVNVNSVKVDGEMIYYMTELETGDSYSVPLRREECS